jgi:hypothetical protein
MPECRDVPSLQASCIRVVRRGRVDAPRPAVTDGVEVGRERLAWVHTRPSDALHALDPGIRGLAGLVAALHADASMGDRIRPPHPSPEPRTAGASVLLDVDGDGRSERRNLVARASHPRTGSGCSEVDW